MTSGVFAVMYEVFVCRRQTEFVLAALGLRESMIQAGLEGLTTNYMEYDYRADINAAQHITLFLLYAQTWNRYEIDLAAHVEQDGRSLTLCAPTLDNSFLEPLRTHFRYGDEEFKRKIADTVARCALLELTRSGGTNGKVRIYLHRARPAYSMYRFDSRILVGTYYAGSARRRAPMFEFADHPGSMFAEFTADLDSVIAEQAELIFDSTTGMNCIEEKLGQYVPESFRATVERRLALARPSN